MLSVIGMWSCLSGGSAVGVVVLVSVDSRLTEPRMPEAMIRLYCVSLLTPRGFHG